MTNQSIDLVQRAQRIRACAESGDAAGMALLLAQCPGAPLSDSEDLGAAAENGHLECVKLLISVCDPKAGNSDALRFAAENGHTECVRALIPVSDPTAANSDALGFAAENGHTECVKLLIPVSDPKALNSYALRKAAENGHSECVRLLIPVSDSRAHQSHALLAAAKYGHLECVRQLIPVSDIDDQYPGPFMLAALRGNSECALLLMPKTEFLILRSETLAGVLRAGDVQIAAAMLGREPLLLSGESLSLALLAATSSGHEELAGLLASIVDFRALSDIDAPARSSTAAPAPLRI